MKRAYECNGPDAMREWYAVTYIVARGEIGKVNMWLDDVPQWLAAHPGYLVCQLEWLATCRKDTQ